MKRDQRVQQQPLWFASFQLFPPHLLRAAVGKYLGRRIRLSAAMRTSEDWLDLQAAPEDHASFLSLCVYIKVMSLCLSEGTSKINARPRFDSLVRVEVSVAVAFLL